VHTHHPPTVADCDDATRGTAGEDLVGLDVEHHAAVLASADGQDVDALDTEEFIGPGAPVHARTTSRVGHSRPSGMVAWSLPILEGLDPSLAYATPTAANPSTMLNSEEPPK